MAKRKRRGENAPPARARRVRLTAEESLKRMEAFPARKERFVAAVRKGKDRGISA